MPQRILFAFFIAFAAASLLAPPPSAAGPQDVFNGNSGRQGRDCACDGAERRRRADAEIERARRELGKIEEREEQEHQRYWAEHARVLRETVRANGGRCDKCEAALAPVKAQHERNTAAIDKDRRRTVAINQCRMAWVNGGCCGTRPRCFAPDSFTPADDSDALRRRVEAEIEKARRDAGEEEEGGEGHRRRDTPRRDPLGFPSAEAAAPPDTPDSILGRPVTSPGPGRSVVLDGAIVIEGDDDFRAAILRELEMVASRPPRCRGSENPGSKLLYAIRDAHSRGRTVTIKNISPDEVARQKIIFEAKKMRGQATGEFVAGPITRAVPSAACCNGVGGSVTLMLDPGLFPLPNGRATPTHVALFHELVHAWHFVNGRGGSEEQRPDPRNPGRLARDFPSLEEFNTIAAERDLTENGYRRCWNLPLRANQHLDSF